jgi:integrase
MASVFERGGRWYLRVKDGAGLWRKIPSEARTKTEARRLAEEFERHAERQRLGLEPLPPVDGGGTLAELLEWWLTNHSSGSPSHEKNKYSVRRHLMASDLARLPLIAVTAQRIEAFLHQKGHEELAPQTLNHLRGFLGRAFSAAIRSGRYPGTNPVVAVKKRKVPRRKPDFLRPEEVMPVLEALAPRWRPLFATALYTGLRKGELLGLRKRDVDLERRLLTVGRSWDRDITKGGREDVIPIAAELVPYLERALDESPTELVFPAEDGSMMRRDVSLEGVLRRALGRAGIATGWRHVCRKKGCGHFERAPNAALRRCPKDGRKLWPKPQVRPIRFHDIRHSTASLLMMSGANPAAVQRILRHSDPRLTTEVYGHLAPEYLRAEVDRLSFGAPALASVQAGEAAQAANSTPFVPVVSPNRDAGGRTAETAGISPTFSAQSTTRSTGLEPVTSGVTGRRSNQLN